jgi:RecB family endonuclease NucS
VDRLLVLEIKRGKLPRGAIEQLHDYFGMLKRQFPTRPVEMMVVANTIPEERRLACEHLNIEPREISEKRFRDVAAEVGYTFRSEIVERSASESGPLPPDESPAAAHI